jgi:hypothetical protein
MLRADGGAALAGVSAKVRGALNVARRAVMWSRVDLTMYPALVNGAGGAVATRNGVVFTIAWSSSATGNRRNGLPRRLETASPARPDNSRRPT